MQKINISGGDISITGKSAYATFVISIVSIFISALLILILSAKKDFIFLGSVGVVLDFIAIYTSFLYFVFFWLSKKLSIVNKLLDFQSVLSKITYVVFVGFSSALLIFVITCVWIGFDVKTQCQDAKSEYRGDCVDALINLVKDDDRGFRVRNDAIWALGQLGDSRALPILERLYTGNIPEREPLDKTISQYELRKAIALASGGKNITAIFWRYGIN